MQQLCFLCFLCFLRFLRFLQRMLRQLPRPSEVKRIPTGSAGGDYLVYLPGLKLSFRLTLRLNTR